MSQTRTIRDFRTVLDLAARGRLVERLDEKLREVLEALEDDDDEAAKGSLQLTMSFQRIGDKIDIKGAVKVALPPDKALPPTTLFVVEGGLSLQHPSQIDMFSGPRDAGVSSKA